MKIAQLILQQLNAEKRLTLQGIGTFFMSASPVSSDQDKTNYQLGDLITFEYNPKAPVDESLILYIMQQTRKIRPLATSDLDSYVELGKQFLNLGKPFLIEGLGVLLKESSGNIEFSIDPTTSLHSEPAQTEMREKKSEDISFASPIRKRKPGKWQWMLVIFAALLIFAAFYYFILRKEEKELVAPIKKIEKTATANQPTTKNTDSSKANTSSSKFKIVIKEYFSQEKATNFYNRLKNDHQLKVYTDDSIKYKVAIPITAPLSDTARVRDSIRKMLDLPVYYEIIPQ